MGVLSNEKVRSFKEERRGKGRMIGRAEGRGGDRRGDERRSRRERRGECWAGQGRVWG